MPEVTVRVRFKRCIQDSQELGSDEHMVSRVFFDVDAVGQMWSDLEVRLKQPVGQSYEEGPLEVGAVSGSYSGPMDHSEFAKCVEGYFRSLVGSAGRGIRISGGAQVRMLDNVYDMPGTCEFTVTSGDGSLGW